MTRNLHNIYIIYIEMHWSVIDAGPCNCGVSGCVISRHQSRPIGMLAPCASAYSLFDDCSRQRIYFVCVFCIRSCGNI